ncbi:AMP-binding protein, partial [Actinomycetota bacterium]|nr:AMP-binding protein [Actinomycetota bacterium]
MRSYRGLIVPFENPLDWTLAKVLRHQACERPNKVYLDAPEEGVTMTYGETLDAAEAVARSLCATGSTYGDRVMILAQNSSQLVLTWFGTAVGGFVEVPINTAYEFDFLAHQIRTAQPTVAIIDDRFAHRFVSIKEDCAGLERFWVIDNGELDTALKTLRDAGWAAEPWDDLLTRREAELPEVVARDLGAIFFTSGTTGPSKGVAMSHSQFYFDAVECYNLTRLTSEDTYMVTT